MSEFPLAGQRGAFRAAAIAFVPELETAPPEVWERLEATVGTALESRPAALARQLALFLRLLDWLARLTRGRRLAELEPARRTVLLRGIERSRFLLLRRGLWGLRTLVFMGYYTQAAVAAGLGYRAAAAGWEARQ